MQDKAGVKELMAPESSTDSTQLQWRQSNVRLRFYKYTLNSSESQNTGRREGDQSVETFLCISFTCQST